MIYKIDKPTNKQTITDLILLLGQYDLDAEIVWHKSTNPRELVLYACIEDKNHPYHNPSCYDLEYETKRILSISY